MELCSDYLESAKKYISGKDNSCKREASRIVGNLAFQYPQAVRDCIPALLGQYRTIHWQRRRCLYAICCLQIFRFTSSKPSKSAIASDEKFIRLHTNSFVRYCLRNRIELFLGMLPQECFICFSHPAMAEREVSSHVRNILFRQFLQRVSKPFVRFRLE